MIRGKFLRSGDDVTEVMAIRFRVFVDEQGFPKDTEIDEYDEMSVYALVYDEHDRPAATGRLCLKDDRFTIGRVCTLKERRGQGLGDLVMRMLLYRALELNAPEVFLDAQIPRVPFYERYGLKPYGEVFSEKNVPHQPMRASREEIDIEGSCKRCANAN